MRETHFRPEIQGIRAIAALLVAIYHLWFGRISGGVDVFFVVSGLLITESLLRSYERNGQIDLWRYLTRLFKRLLPAAMFVLLTVVAASLIWMPQVRWSQIVGEIFASALYYENWKLAYTTTDYLAEGAARSPVQHYWALSIQGQFYLLWPALFTITAFVAKRLGASLRQGLAVAFAAVFAASLVFSIHATAANQVFHYFNTFARIWEFAMGGLLALLLPTIALGNIARMVLGWLGVIAIVTAGALIPSEMFPGYASLWPTMAAVLIIVAGSGRVAWGADMLLASRPLQWLGGISYSLYLWHWPLMVFFMAAKDREELRNGQAIGILVASILLAWLTTRLIESPLRFSRVGQSKRRHGLIFALVCLLPVLVAAGGWQVHLDRQARLLEKYLVDSPTHPGAAVTLAGIEPVPDPAASVVPPSIVAKDDLPRVYADGCHQTTSDPEPLPCEFGDDEGDVTVALVGGSHAAHWLPALRRLASERGWWIVSYTKSACRFTANHRRGDPSCREWNDRVVEYLVELQPDIVVTTGTVGDGADEHTPDGYVQQWQRLGEREVSVVAFRDTPRIGFDGPECIERYGPDSELCKWRLDERRASRNPLLDRGDLPDNVHVFDPLHMFCVEAVCPSVIGNVLVYRDHHHITATYARTMAPAIGEVLDEAMKRNVPMTYR